MDWVLFPTSVGSVLCLKHFAPTYACVFMVVSISYGSSKRNMNSFRVWVSTWAHYVLRQGEQRAVESVPYIMFMREECMCTLGVFIVLSMCAVLVYSPYTYLGAKS